MKILSVAEKPSVARAIAYLLDHNCRTERGKHRLCPNIHLRVSFGGSNCAMVFTSVLGHLFEHDFLGYRSWTASDPRALFSAPISRSIPSGMQPIADNILHQASSSDMVAIWTDCDREGENIAMQIRSLLPSHIEVRRARFSALSFSEIIGALRTLGNINMNESDAVEARIELDLRVGSAFTRLQTLAASRPPQPLPSPHNPRQPSSSPLSSIISFGPCQMPTLNFVVQRHRRVERFTAEKLFSLVCQVSSLVDSNTGQRATVPSPATPVQRRKATKSALYGTFGVRNGTGGNSEAPVVTKFTWDRGTVIDRNCAYLFCSSLHMPLITSIQKTDRKRLRPLPLRTVELQKVCGAVTRLSGTRLMEIAEKLYVSGYISYPRTETDAFPPKFDYKSVLASLCSDSSLSEYASKLETAPKPPRSGPHSDQAHSPIYPLKAGTGLSGDERRVYEFVARHFLACISEDAHGVETVVQMEMEVRQSTGRTSSDGKNEMKVGVSCSTDQKSLTSARREGKQAQGKNTSYYGAEEATLKSTSVKEHKNSSKQKAAPWKERFTARGLRITNRGYLEVYSVYDSWNESIIGDFFVGQSLSTSEYNLFVSETESKSPEHLTEAELVALMDKNGIGTDATIHEHIEKIQTRKYAALVSGSSGSSSKKRMVPTALGIGIIDAYEAIGLGIAEPGMRSALENGLREIASGEKSKEELVAREIAAYTASYDMLADNISVFVNAIRDHYQNQSDTRPPAPPSSSSGGNSFSHTNRRRRDIRQRTATRFSEAAERIDMEAATPGAERQQRQHRYQSPLSATSSLFTTARAVQDREQRSRIDDRESARARRRNFERSAAVTSRYPNRDSGQESDIIQCECGHDAARKIAHTQENAGRPFFCCSKSYRRCKFFKWADT